MIIKHIGAYKSEEELSEKVTEQLEKGFKLLNIIVNEFGFHAFLTFDANK